jgi:hypothetical protein
MFSFSALSATAVRAVSHHQLFSAITNQSLTHCLGLSQFPRLYQFQTQLLAIGLPTYAWSEIMQSNLTKPAKGNWLFLPRGASHSPLLSKLSRASEASQSGTLKTSYFIYGTVHLDTATFA